MSITRAKLSDFPTGWERNPDREDIVHTSCLEIFRTAARDISCAAAILHIDDARKDFDRSAFLEAWNILGFQKQLPFFQPDGVAQLMKSDPEIWELSDTVEQKAKNIEPQLRELSELYCQMADQNRAMVSLIPNWREPEIDARRHAPHEFEVLNRVFFDTGTNLRTNEGIFTVPEGDFLYMKPYMEHYPGFMKAKDDKQPRLTVIVR